MGEKSLDALQDGTLRGIIKKANAIDITKDDIVDIKFANGYWYLIYYN